MKPGNRDASLVSGRKYSDMRAGFEAKGLSACGPLPAIDMACFLVDDAAMQAVERLMRRG